MEGGELGLLCTARDLLAMQRMLCSLDQAQGTERLRIAWEWSVMEAVLCQDI